MTSAYALRAAPSGPQFLGNAGDVLTMQADGKASFQPGSGGGGGARATSSGSAAALLGRLAFSAMPMAISIMGTPPTPTPAALATASGAASAFGAGLGFSPMPLAISVSTAQIPAALASSSGTASAPFGGLSFSAMPTGAVGGLSPAVPVPAAVALASSSGSGTDGLGFATFSAMPTGAVGGFSPAVPVPAPTALASSSGGGVIGDMGALDFSPMVGANQGFQGGRAQSFVFNVIVPGGGSIPGNSGTSLTVTVPGVLASDAIQANQTSAVFASGISIVNAYASGGSQITLQILNCTTTSQAIPTNFPLRVGATRN